MNSGLVGKRQSLKTVLKMFKTFIVFILSAVIMTGCAIGNKSQYTGGLSFKSEVPPNAASVVVTVQDNRPYVLDGSKTESYVGTMRSIGGVPWPIKTETGRPLAVDLGESIVTTLNLNGYKAVQLQTLPQSNDAEIVRQLSAVSSDSSARILHFLIKEWRNHTWFITTFHFCVDLNVKSSLGNLLASTTECGEEELGSSNPQFSTLSSAIATVIGKLVNASQIKAALTGGPVSPVVTKNEILPPQKSKLLKSEEKCSTKQILKMKELNFTDSQIATSCP